METMRYAIVRVISGILTTGLIVAIVFAIKAAIENFPKYAIDWKGVCLNILIILLIAMILIIMFVIGHIVLLITGLDKLIMY